MLTEIFSFELFLAVIISFLAGFYLSFMYFSSLVQNDPKMGHSSRDNLIPYCGHKHGWAVKPMLTWNNIPRVH